LNPAIVRSAGRRVVCFAPRLAALSIALIAIATASACDSGNASPAPSPSATSVVADYFARHPAATPTPITKRVTEVLRAGNWQYEVRLVKRFDHIANVKPRGEFLFVYFELINLATRNFGIGPHDFEVVGMINHYEADTSRGS